MSETEEDRIDGTGADDQEGTDGTSEGTDWRAHLIRGGHVLGVLVLLAIVLPFVLYAVPQVIGAEASYVVTSPSMEPKLSPYDVIFVDEVDPASVEEGDVINYQRSSDPSTTTHQVFEVVEQDGAPAFRTIGINNEGPDQGVVTPDEFRGRVMTVGGTPLAIPYMGRALQFANTGIGFALLFVIPVALLVLDGVWNVIGPVRTEGSSGTGASDGTQEGEAPDVDDSERVDEGEGAVALSAGEVRLALLVLAAFVAYGAWTAYANLNPITVGITASTSVALLLMTGLYLAGGSQDNEQDAHTETARSGVLIETRARPTGDVGETETVSVLDALVDLARGTDGRLARDPDENVYHLTVADTHYVYDPADGTGEETVTPQEGAANEARVEDGPLDGERPADAAAVSGTEDADD